MIRAGLALTLCVLAPLIAFARAGLPSNNPTLHPTGACYVGPGDIIPSAISYAGFRAYDCAHALARVNAIELKRNGDSATTNITVLSNGQLDSPTANAFCAAAGSTQCNVVGLWDQITNVLMPNQAGPGALYVPLCANGLSCANNDSTDNGYYYETSAPTINQPTTIYINDDGIASSGVSYFGGCTSGGQEVYYSHLNIAYIFAGTLLSYNLFGFGRYAIFNGVSSAMYQNNAALVSSGDAGSQNCGASSTIFVIGNGGPAIGRFWEQAIWGSVINTTQMLNLFNNWDGFWKTV